MIQKFYTGSDSRTFVMKDHHILPGSIGIARWPLDMHWYRIKVDSIISEDSVKVFFVDYGTTDIISKTLLRYIREDFISFPAQAMKASLAYVKPPKGFSTWSSIPAATDRILDLSLDESVKAKVEDIVDDVLSVILYNQNYLFINGVLLDENLAQSTSVDSYFPELVDFSEMASLVSNNPTCELPPVISKPSEEAWQPFSSTTQASENRYKEPSTCVNISKPFETASTSVTASIKCPKSQIVKNGPFLHKPSTLPNDAAADFGSFSPSNNRITADGYLFHILIYNSEPYVSGGDVSHIIWSNKDSAYLLQRLQNIDSSLSSILIWEDENEDMFNQLKRFHVKGFQILNERTCLLIFSLNNLVKILNMFGHPSVELRTKIIQEFSNFNLNHPVWKEISESEFPDVEEKFSDRKDDDKFDRLCLCDLQVIKEQ